MNCLRPCKFNNQQPELIQGEFICNEYVVNQIMDNDKTVATNTYNCYLTERAIYFQSADQQQNTFNISNSRFLVEDVLYQSPKSIELNRNSVKIQFNQQPIKLHSYNYTQETNIVVLQFSNTKQSKDFHQKLENIISTKAFEKFQQKSGLGALGSQAIKQQQQQQISKIQQNMNINSLSDLKQNAQQLIGSAKQLSQQLLLITDEQQKLKIQKILDQIFGYQSEIKLQSTLNQTQIQKLKQNDFLQLLSQQLCEFLVKKNKLIYQLNTTYSQFNRFLNGTHLVSPKDYRSACQLLQQFEIIQLQSQYFIVQKINNTSLLTYLNNLIKQVLNLQKNKQAGASPLQLIQQINTDPSQTIIKNRVTANFLTSVIEELVLNDQLCYYDGNGERLYFPNLF